MDKRIVIGAVVVVGVALAIVFSGALGGGGIATPTPIAEASPSPSAVTSASPSALSGTIEAVVSFKGTAPAPRKIRKTPECGSDPLFDEEVAVSNGKLANVMVRVVGIPAVEGRGQGAEIVQEECVYAPRVSGIVAGQSIAVTSKDNFLHNVHTFRGDASIFNKGQPAPGTFVKEAADFTAVNGQTINDGPITFKCDVHPWMISHVVVNPNPYFAVSGADGAAKISLPAGTYQLEAWHEKLGTKTASVTVVAGQPAAVAIDFP